MPTQSIPGFHLVRFGTAADQQFLLGEFLPTYDQLIINANMVAHMPAALASFLSIKAKNKPYFIDPQTHAFQHDISHIESVSESKAGEIKRSLQKLIQAFGNPVMSCVSKDHRPLIPSDLINRNVLVGFCNRVLEFQLHTISNEINQSDAAKYYRYLNKIKGTDESSNLLPPSLVIAPYFYMTASTFNKWLPVNLECANISKDMAKKIGQHIGVQIVLSQDLLLDSVQIAQLIAAYIKTEPDVFLVWIDSFSEQEASEQELTVFINLLKQLGEVKPVVNLYGGFFSVVLHHCGILKNLVGVAHGLEYGETRSVVPVGGGIPTAKFYFPELNSRLVFRDAFRAVRAIGGHESVKDFHEKVCDCKTCKVAIAANPDVDFEKYGRSRPVHFWRKDQPVVMSYPLPETREKTVKHYMWCKKKEYQYRCSTSDIISNLEGIKTKLEKPLGLSKVIHCEVWAKLLKRETKV